MGHHKHKHSGTTNLKTGVIVGGLPPKRKLPRFSHKVVAIVLVVAAVAVTLLAATRLVPRNTAVCSDKVIQQSSGYINDNNTEELQKLSDSIIRKKGYETDTNCLYIVTTNYVQAGDAVNGRKYVDKLSAVYNEQQGYSRLFGDRTKAPYQLRGIVEFLEQTSSQPARSFYIGDPSQ